LYRKKENELIFLFVCILNGAFVIFFILKCEKYNKLAAVVGLILLGRIKLTTPLALQGKGRVGTSCLPKGFGTKP